ncbi:hypothetical protein A0256_08905 [Mucilaginibacter sp. PAMC 26640]|nr:hypothetical protein A0256_08905 [Mucilaginibacter sp. PAMC 26640]
MVQLERPVRFFSIKIKPAVKGQAFTDFAMLNRKLSVVAQNTIPQAIYKVRSDKSEIGQLSF